jgi:hypothetical protein
MCCVVSRNDAVITDVLCGPCMHDCQRSVRMLMPAGPTPTLLLTVA